MTMPSSGPLNMAGTTTPQSVANELGLDLTTAISMNTAAVRVLAGAGASGTAWSLSSMYGKINNWIFSSTTLQRTAAPAAISTSQGGLYLVSSSVVQKININSGASLWISTPTVAITPVGTAIDSAGDIWLADQAGLTKVDPASGSLTASFSVTNPTDYRHVFQGIATAEAGSYVYLGGYRQPTISATYVMVSKFNLSGALQWARYWAGDSPSAVAVAVDTADNSYAWGFANNGSGTIKPSLIKINASGTLQWQTVFNLNSPDSPPSGSVPWAIGVDASNNIYVGVTGSDQTSTILAKFNSSGVLQWQKTVNAGGAPGLIFGAFAYITVDSAGSVYYAVSGISGAVNGVRIFKFTDSGTLVWQRFFEQTVPSANISACSLSTDNVGNLYVGCGTFMLKAPVDGLKTGTFTVAGKTFSYSASGLSVSTPTYTTTAGTISLTSYTPTVTSQSTATTITPGSTTVTTI